MSADRTVLRELARRYAEVAADPRQEERRGLWRRQNSLKGDRPLIYLRAFAWKEMPQSQCECVDPFYRQMERQLRHRLFWSALEDDSVFEPWLTVNAAKTCKGWGIEGVKQYSDDPRGSYKEDYPLKQPEDIEKLCAPRHGIDEDETARHVDRLRDVLGDLVTVNVGRCPAYTRWMGDLSTSLGHLRGIENFMMDMMDRPQWLHQLLDFMSQGVLRAQEQAEQAGDWGLGDHDNQSIPYADELRDPAANVTGVKRSDLWAYAAAQEFTAVSPAMHDEFLLQYQIRILKHFGLVAYGCCEDLTRKIDILRQIPRLRRIAVAPIADVARCAEQIGTDYVISYRPSPSDMVGYGFDPDRVRRILKNDLEACRNCHVDITLKDVETVQNDPERVRKWLGIARSVIEELWGVALSASYRFIDRIGHPDPPSEDRGQGRCRRMWRARIPSRRSLRIVRDQARRQRIAALQTENQPEVVAP